MKAEAQVGRQLDISNYQVLLIEVETNNMNERGTSGLSELVSFWSGATRTICW